MHMLKYTYSICLVCLCFFISCGETKDKDKQGTQRESIFVKVMEITSSDGFRDQRYTGLIEESKGTMLSFEVPGNIQTISVNKGDKVSKGQLLASLDQLQLRNTHEIAAASLYQAQDAYNRYKQLYDNNSLPEIKWVEVKSKLNEANASEKIARKNLNNANLYAPYSGYIGERIVDPGTNVAPGSAILKLVTIDKVNVRAAIPEKEINSIKVGQEAIIDIPALNKEVKAEVTEKGVVADRLSHSYDIKIAMDNPAFDMFPGMICNVSILSADKRPQIVIPNAAVGIDPDGKTFIWLAVNGKAQRKYISTGSQTNRGVIVSEGLRDGDKLIVEGNQKISSGMNIEIR